MQEGGRRMDRTLPTAKKALSLTFYLIL